jgi:hypothetical protein
LTLLSETAAFLHALRAFAVRFRQQESLIRQQYARAEGTTEPPKSVLERATRRFLIDNLLRALDWNPDDPTQMTEEARAISPGSDWLYFDYLGVNPATQAPVLLFEAKGFGVPMPRKPREEVPTPQDMTKLIADAIDAIKKGKQPDVTADWAEFLGDLHAYIRSLDRLGRSTLRRAAITAGQWLIVFRDPVATFGTQGLSNTEHIDCFTSIEDLLERHAEVYGLLHRRRLIDTLPLTLTVAEALAMIPAQHVGDAFRAVLVATSPESGARRQQYPTRSVYPAILVKTGDRLFTIVDFQRAIEEPKGSERIDSFLAELAARGVALEETLARSYGRPLLPAPIEDFPGFPPPRVENELRIGALAPVAGSTAERQGTGGDEKRRLVVDSGERGAVSEYVVVTGTAWFYKADRPIGPACAYHFWKGARDVSAAGARPLTQYLVDSFTEDGQDRHCAHDHLVGLRASRCHVRPLETQMCCRSCLFFTDCWSSEVHRMPCP